MKFVVKTKASKQYQYVEFDVMADQIFSIVFEVPQNWDVTQIEDQLIPFLINTFSSYSYTMEYSIIAAECVPQYFLSVIPEILESAPYVFDTAQKIKKDGQYVWCIVESNLGESACLYVNTVLTTAFEQVKTAAENLTRWAASIGNVYGTYEAQPIAADKVIGSYFVLEPKEEGMV